MIRYLDNQCIDYRKQRQDPVGPTGNAILEPGHMLLPEACMGVGAVVATSVIVTAFDAGLARGGICHFVLPRPPRDKPPTPLFGLPALVKLLREVATWGGSLGDLQIGVYGGAIPPWATAHQRQISAENVSIVRRVMAKKGVRIVDEDVGGERGRKIWYLTGTNEIAVVKTLAVRSTDWYPMMPEEGWTT